MHCNWRPFEPDAGCHNILPCSHYRAVYIALIMATLHDLEVKAAAVLHAYKTALNGEKIWTVSRPEFGYYAGMSAIVARAHR